MTMTDVALTQGIDCSVSAGSSGCESGVFGRGMAVDTKGLGDGIGRFACRDSPCYLVPKLPRDSWPSNALALCPGSSHSGPSALGDPHLGRGLGQLIASRVPTETGRPPDTVAAARGCWSVGVLIGG